MEPMADGGGGRNSPLHERCNLYVDGVSELDDTRFRELFAEHGQVVRSKIMMGPQGQNLGYGFVEYASEEAATQAIVAKNNLRIGSSTLRVQYKRVNNPKPSSTAPTNVYVVNFPKSYTQENLENLFAPFGTIKQSRILVDTSGQSRGVGFVRFADTASAQQAIRSLNGSIPPNGVEQLQVKFARDTSIKPHPNGGSPSPNLPTEAVLAAAQLLLQAGLGQALGLSGGGSGGYQPVRNDNGRSSAPYPHANRPRPPTPAPPSNYMLPDPYAQPGAHPQYGPISTAPQPIMPFSAPLSSMPPQMAMQAMPGMMPPSQMPLMPQPIPASMPGPSPHQTTLFVFHLPVHMTEAELTSLFALFGVVSSVRIIRNPGTGESKGYGFVNMLSDHDAVNAIQHLNGYQIGNKHLKVSLKQ